MALAGLFLAGGAQAAGYGENLVANGGAEASVGVASTSVTTMFPPFGWTTAGSMTAAQYGGAGGFPLAVSPGPIDRGINFFAGGRGSGMMGGSVATASQTISLASFLGDIADGDVGFTLSAYLGGYSNDNDRAGLGVSFLDASGAIIGSYALSPVTAVDRANVTGLFYRETSGFVPTGAVSVSVLLEMTKAKGMYNDASADNIVFALTAPPVPEPETYALMLAGLGVVGALRRRRRAA